MDLDRNSQRNRFRGGNPGKKGFQIFLAETVDTTVVIFIGMNSLGKDQEVITH